MNKIFLTACVLVILTIDLACDKDEIKEDPLITTGRELFNDTKFSTANDRSCGYCHPGGDMDNEQWHLPPIHDTTNGIPNKYSTPTLFGVSETGPYLWKGQGGNDLRSLTQTIVQSVQGGTVTSDELDAIVAYMLSLKVPANPWKNTDGSLSEVQARGKKVFENQGHCITCHSGVVLTGRFKIEIFKAQAQFDVPSLRWVFSTAPYFHDGSAANLKDVINHYADSITTVQMTTWGWNARGIFDISLTQQEKNDLFEYLRTL